MFNVEAVSVCSISSRDSQSIQIAVAAAASSKCADAQKLFRAWCEHAVSACLCWFVRSKCLQRQAIMCYPLSSSVFKFNRSRLNVICSWLSMTLYLYSNSILNILWYVFFVHVCIVVGDCVCCCFFLSLGCQLWTGAEFPQHSSGANGSATLPGYSTTFLCEKKHMPGIQCSVVSVVTDRFISCALLAACSWAVCNMHA